MSGSLNPEPVALRLLRQRLPDVIRLRSLVGPGDVAALLPEEAKHVAHMAGRRAEEFAAGRICARAALGALGLPGLAVGRREDRAPIWPVNVVGSISHTEGYSASAVAWRKEVTALGIDIEQADRVERELWPLLLVPAEIVMIESRPAYEQGQLAPLLFSAKEAYFKFQNFLWGDWLDFVDVEVTIISAEFLEVRRLCAGEARSARGAYAVVDGLTAVCLFALAAPTT